MITQEFKIKGMICSRCLKVLNNELNATGAKVVDIQLGKVVINYRPEKIDRSIIEHIIVGNEFEIITSENEILGEQTKRWIINYIYNSDLSTNLSSFLRSNIPKKYSMISDNFSNIFGQTIERYAILLKIERTKELIEMGKLNFTQIAYLLGYSNLSGLSRQFKQETGDTMKKYKEKREVRTPIDKIR
tara:strand:+ start:4460 stop:5023 length:564 start_codon:yes stop_codon:yes gene_type:complete